MASILGRASCLPLDPEGGPEGRALLSPGVGCPGGDGVCGRGPQVELPRHSGYKRVNIVLPLRKSVRHVDAEMLSALVYLSSS